MLIARLTAKGWFRRTWAVEARGGGPPHTIRYSGWGIGSEAVLLDEVVVVRRQGLGLMSHGYRFDLDDGRHVALSVAVPWWCNLIPVCSLSYVRLEIDGTTVYEEGRAPARPLKWTTTVRGFPVVPTRPDQVPRQ